MGSQNPADQLREDMQNAMHESRPGTSGIQAPSGGLSMHPGAGTGAPEILSDTQGVDFSDWLARWHYVTQRTWDPLIPDEVNPPILKSGVVAVRFKVLPNGQVVDMQLGRPLRRHRPRPRCVGRDHRLQLSRRCPASSTAPTSSSALTSSTTCSRGNPHSHVLTFCSAETNASQLSLAILCSPSSFLFSTLSVSWLPVFSRPRICIQLLSLSRLRSVLSTAFARIHMALEENSILLQQRFVDRRVPPVPRQRKGAHVGDHQRQHQPIAAGHLKDDQDRRHRRAHDTRKHRAHAHHRKRADRVGRSDERQSHPDSPPRRPAFRP